MNTCEVMPLHWLVAYITTIVVSLSVLLLRLRSFYPFLSSSTFSINSLKSSVLFLGPTKCSATHGVVGFQPIQLRLLLWCISVLSLDLSVCWQVFRVELYYFVQVVS